MNYRKTIAMFAAVMVAATAIGATATPTDRSLLGVHVVKADSHS